MSRVEFKTGKKHQEKAAIWARQRLADRRGRQFTHPDDQDGVIFADSVGLGKTWEALGAAALILYKKIRRKKGKGHVLIMCPANLVTKWEDELTAGSPFTDHLAKWVSDRVHNRSDEAGHYVQCIQNTLTHVLPIRSAEHVRTRRKNHKFKVEGGTYIVSQSLIIRKGKGLNALRRQKWDLIIIDEAHNSSAHKALDAVQQHRRAHTKLMLTATPFQLEPHQWNKLTGKIVKHGHKILKQPEVAAYIDQLAKYFSSSNEKDMPLKSIVDRTGVTFRKLVVRSIPNTMNRHYEILLFDGSTKKLNESLDKYSDDNLRNTLREFRSATVLTRDYDFETAYFDKRYQLATNEPTFVSTRLRRFLSMGTAANVSPRLRALKKWAEQAFMKDIINAIETGGLPHKTIVFTSWIGDKTIGEANVLRKYLSDAFSVSFCAARNHYKKDWLAWSIKGKDLLTKAAFKISGKSASALTALSGDELTTALVGKHPKLVSGLSKSLSDREKAIVKAKNEKRETPNSFEKRAIGRRINDLIATLSPLTTGKKLRPVECYTSNEGRIDRDRHATAFREIGPPWVLVASNVGSEGIDLHTYTARIVHYDMEWNPARMEQREGRGDRVGRRLKDKLSIIYCLVPRTYDERMFYQLVARDRWHGVLLGKPSSKLIDEKVDAPLIDRASLRKMRLDLAPRI